MPSNDAHLHLHNNSPNSLLTLASICKDQQTLLRGHHVEVSIKNLVFINTDTPNIHTRTHTNTQLKYSPIILYKLHASWLASIRIYC